MNRSISAQTCTFAAVALVVTMILSTAGCASAPPPAVDQRPDGIQTMPAEEPAEPVLTIDESYQAISYAVQAGDPQAAIAAYEAARVEDPADPGTRVLLANLYLIAGAIADAESLLGEVLNDDPDNPDALFLLSLAAAANGDRDRQGVILQDLLRVDPDNAKALAALGELQLQDRQYDQAEDSFAAALAREDNNLVARMGLANVLLRKDEFEAAERELSAVIAAEPDYPYAYADRARARALQRNLTGAASDLTAAIDRDPEYSWHFIDRGRVYLEQRRFREAQEDFSAAIALDSDQFISFILRARARDALGLIDDALADYATGVGMRPDYYPAYAPYATLLYMARSFDSSAAYYRKAFAADGRRLEYILTATLALKAAGKAAAANDWLTENLSKLPRDTVYYSVARYYLTPSTEGSTMATIGAERNDTVKGQMYFYLGAQLALLGRDATAQAALLEAEELLSPAVIEGRLARWHLEEYRTGQPAADPAEEGD